MDLTLHLPPGRTAVLTLRTRATETVVGSAITGVPDGTDTTKYVFAVSQADGDYDASLAGISTPAGPRFALRKTSTAIAVAATWPEMNAILYDPDIPASTPPRVTGFWRVYDKYGVLEPGALVVLVNADAGLGATGYALDTAPRTVAADTNGIASFTNLFTGAKYIASRSGSGRKFLVTVPAGDGPVALGSITG